MQLRLTLPRSRLFDVIGANEEMFLSDRAFISDLSILRARSLRYAERSTRLSPFSFALLHAIPRGKSRSLFAFLDVPFVNNFNRSDVVNNCRD